MKNLLIVCNLLFLAEISLATDWFPVGARWTWGQIDECCGPPPRPDYPFYWNAQKDTFIQGKACAIVEKEGNYYPQQAIWTYRYIYNNDNGKITRFINDNFLPVYDFNKNIGDTSYIVTDSGNYICDTFLFIIDSIKPLQQNNNLKVQYGKLFGNTGCPYSNRPVDYLTIIEKIGLPFLYSKYYYYITDGSPEYARCYKDSEYDLHITSMDCDSIIDKIKEKLNTNLPIKVFPNPSSDKIQVEYYGINKYKDVKLFLVDLNGKVIKSVENNLQMNVSDVSNGLYYLKILFDKEFVTKSIIIQH